MLVPEVNVRTGEGRNKMDGWRLMKRKRNWCVNRPRAVSRPSSHTRTISLVFCQSCVERRRAGRLKAPLFSSTSFPLAPLSFPCCLAPKKENVGEKRLSFSFHGSLLSTRLWHLFFLPPDWYFPFLFSHKRLLFTYSWLEKEKDRRREEAWEWRTSSWHASYFLSSSSCHGSFFSTASSSESLIFFSIFFLQAPWIVSSS